MRQTLLLHRVCHGASGMTVAEVLEMATLGSARVMRLEDRIGSLEPGKRADIIQVSFDDVHFVPTYDVTSHLVYVADEQDVITTIVEGRVLMRDGEILTIDTERVAREGVPADL